MLRREKPDPGPSTQSTWSAAGQRVYPHPNPRLLSQRDSHPFCRAGLFTGQSHRLRFFRDLSQQAILPGSFGSVRQLVDSIMQYLAEHNLNPKRYVWRAKGEEILAKIQRAWKAALAEK